MDKNGTITREGDEFVVRANGGTYLLDQPGVDCENHDAPEGERVYVKRFKNKRIYLPGEYERAVKENLIGKDVLVIGMNGYSALSVAQCDAWGVQPGAYEAACEGILRATYQSLSEAFPGIDIRFAHGASNMGVDKSIMKVARGLNRGELGHNCPKYMFYVEDDDAAVYVAASSDEYAEAFIDSLDVLIACNGRAQAFSHDIDAVFKKLKHVIPVNVLRSISTNGGPPAIGPDGRIEDAVAAFEQRVHMVAQQMFVASRDPFADLVVHICEAATSIARQFISPERAFANVLPSIAWRRTR
jgi:hypothetical protein